MAYQETDLIEVCDRLGQFVTLRNAGSKPALCYVSLASFVTPAKAGVQLSTGRPWISAFAGMTKDEDVGYRRSDERSRRFLPTPSRIFYRLRGRYSLFY